MPQPTQQSDEHHALQQAIDARAEAARQLAERRDALSRTKAALAETDGFLQNAQADLEAAIAEIADEGAISPLLDGAAAHAERIARLQQEIAVRVRIRDKLKDDVNQAGLAYRRAMDDVALAMRPILRAESARLA